MDPDIDIDIIYRGKRIVKKASAETHMTSIECKRKQGLLFKKRANAGPHSSKLLPLDTVGT